MIADTKGKAADDGACKKDAVVAAAVPNGGLAPAPVTVRSDAVYTDNDAIERIRKNRLTEIDGRRSHLLLAMCTSLTVCVVALSVASPLALCSVCGAVLCAVFGDVFRGVLHFVPLCLVVEKESRIRVVKFG